MSNNQCITYTSSTLPKRNKFIIGLMYLRFPLFIPLVKVFIKSRLKDCGEVEFLPSFQFYYGKIHAKKAFLSNSWFIDYGDIYIGNNVGFGFDCIVFTSKHNPHNFNEVIIEPVTIGSNTVIHSRCLILSGVSIGENVIIGAGSVVTKDLPANCFAAGNPARVIRYLNEEAET